MIRKVLLTLIALTGLILVSATNTPNAEAQPLAGYCCDAYGYRQCVLENPVPPGNGCFCFGKGYGVTCF